MPENVMKSLKQRFDYIRDRDSADWEAISIPADKHREFFEAFHKDGEYEMLVDVTAIDWEKSQSARFTMVYHFYSLLHHHYVRITCDCASNEEPTIPTVADLWPSADWHEREVYDMFGIHFDNHPDLRRILMWDEYPYHPLRKEFPLAGIDTELPAADVAEVTQAKVTPAPMMGGPFHAASAEHMSTREPRAADQSWTEHHEKPAETEK